MNTLRSIITDPSAPALHQVCPDLTPEQVAGQEVWDLAQVMNWLMERTPHGAWGLAAPQVGSNLRVCLFRYALRGEVQVAANLHITRRWGERKVEEECLSVPGGPRSGIRRSERVSATWLDLKGMRHSFRRANGDFAQLLEHEHDHLEGVLYTEREI